MTAHRLLCAQGCKLAVLLVSAFVFASAEAEPMALRPFTVEVGIHAERVLTLSGRAFPESATPLADQFALFSPDGNRFVVRTRRGDLARDVNIDTILMWKTADIGKEPVRLHTHAFHDDGGGVESLAWQSATRLSFIARSEAGIDQAFIVDTDTKRVTQLTQSPTNVVSFATSKHQTIYYAREPSAPPPTVVDATDATLYDLYRLDAGTSDALALYKQTKGSRKPQRLTPEAYSSAQPSIWISPDERYAITLAPEVDPPPSWSRFQVRTRAYTDIGVRDAKNPENAQRLRYIVIDLKDGAERPLLDAPAGLLAGNGTPLEVFWVGGGQSVIVSNTYVPLAAAILNPVIAEISLGTGAARVIAAEPVAKPGQPLQGKVVRIGYDDTLKELVVTRKTSDAFTVETYRREASGWSLARTEAASSSSAPELRVWLRQSAVERPKLYAAVGGGAEREIYDPNPELNGYTFGRQEGFTFQFQGKARSAAVIYPVSYREGERYPLILQTHGLGKDQYVLDGPVGSTTSYAAQALANVGFVVAQLPDVRVDGYNTAQEGPDNAEYWHTAVEALASRGLIDRENIGVISWSRTGYHLLAALSRYPQLFKAASMADSIQYGSYLQILATPARNDRIQSHAEMTTGKVFERGLARWIEDQNVFYGALRSATPLRIESIGSPVSMWETFAVRRMQGYPVEHVYYPTGSHILMKPSERLASQGGSVDWFRFWLQGYEDPAPTKAHQYERWRAMRSAGTKPH